MAGWRTATRLVMVLLSADGMTAADIGELLGCHRGTVRRWLDRFAAAGVDDLADRPRSGRPPIGKHRLCQRIAGLLATPGPWTIRRLWQRWAGGVDGLADRPGAGRPRRLTEAQRSQIVALVGAPAPGRPEVNEGTGTLEAADANGPGCWTLDTLAEAAQGLGITVGRSQVRRILAAEGVRWRQPRSWAQSSDPDFVPKGPGNPSIAVGMNGASRTIFLNWVYTDSDGGVPATDAVAAITINSTDPPPPINGQDIKLTQGGITNDIRFGDYSSTMIDPVNVNQVCAVTAQQYIDSNGKWATYISRFGAPGC